MDVVVSFRAATREELITKIHVPLAPEAWARRRASRTSEARRWRSPTHGGTIAAFVGSPANGHRSSWSTPRGSW